MKKKPQILYILPVIAITAILASCTGNFDSYNTNKFNVTEDQMQADGLIYGAPLAQMQRNVLPYSQQPDFGDEKYQVVQNLCGDIFSGMMAPPRYWVRNGDNTTFALYPNWYSQPFDHAFEYVMGPWNSIRKRHLEEDVPQIYAIAQIMKVFAMHRVTDMYGPLPYLKFGTVTGTINYDSQEAIYDSFFEDLEDAVDVLQDYITGNPGSKILPAYDYIYAGDPSSWIKFANSLRLRLAMRIFYADQAKARTNAERAVDPERGGVFTVNNDMARLVSGNTINFHHPLNEITNSFADIRMGAPMESYMKGYKDPRMERYFLPAEADGEYHGMRIAIDIASDDANYKAGTSKLNIARDQYIMWMGTPEVYFLLAEGILRGWNMQESDAKEMYQQGITLSMQLWGASIGDYLSNTDEPTSYVDPVNTNRNTGQAGTVTVNWDDAADDTERLQKIITQKWLALYPDGMEGWSEYRRTGYPTIYPAQQNDSGGTVPNTGPARMPFPTSEYLGNPGISTGQALLGGADNGGTKVWWNK